LVLQIIAAKGEAGAGAISEASRLSQATVTALLDRLEERRLVLRRRDTADRRRVTVELTAEGRAALNSTPDVLQDRFAARFNRLPNWEQASLVSALERVTALLDAEGMDASPVIDIGSLDRPAGASPQGEDD
jgi:DNA-binding MarR family transcriptional regulator